MHTTWPDKATRPSWAPQRALD